MTKNFIGKRELFFVLLIVGILGTAFLLHYDQGSPESNFEVKNMEVTILTEPSQSGDNGRSVLVKAQIMGPVNEEKIHKIILKLDGEPVKSKKVSLEPEVIKNVEFELQNLKSGTHSVKISNFSKTFEVEETIDLKPYMENASKLRDLEFEKNIPVEIISENELRSHVENDLENQYPEGFRNSKLTLSAFGLFPRNKSLKSKLLELHTQEVTGFYIPEKDKFFIVKHDSEKNLNEKLSDSIIIHELTHAIQDQNFNLETIPIDGNSNDDLSQSVTGLIEGGATYTQLKYVIGDQNLDILLEGDLGAQYRTRLNSVTSEEKNNDIPLILEKSLKFPYYAGTLFVSEIKQNGWNKVNQAYSDLPSSTEQILHPEKYRENRDYPVRLELPQLESTMKGSWKPLEKNSFGEYAIGIMFLKFFRSRSARKKNLEARNGWDGDTYKTFLRENDNIVGLTWLSTWDSPEDAQEFHASYLKVLKEKYPNYSTVSENYNVSLIDTPKGKVLVEKRNKDVLILEGFSRTETNQLKEKIWTETTRQVLKHVNRKAE